MDLFRSDSRDIQGCKFWFLTHFHADHYGGLTKKFSQGLVVCTPVTARLINAKLRVRTGCRASGEGGHDEC